MGSGVLLAASAQQPFHHGHTAGSTSSLTLAPFRAEMGMIFTSVRTCRGARAHTWRRQRRQQREEEEEEEKEKEKEGRRGGGGVQERRQEEKR